METTQILQDLWEYIKNSPDTWAGLAIIVVLLFIWAAYRRSHRTFSIARSGEGTVRVSQSALHGFVKGACEKMGNLSCSSIDFNKNGVKFDVDIKLKVHVSQSATDLPKKLHEVLTYSIGKVLGPEKIGKINIVITGFKGDIKDNTLPSNTQATPAEEFKVIEK